MAGKEAYAALFRGLRVKKKFTFAVKLKSSCGIDKPIESSENKAYDNSEQTEGQGESRRKLRQQLREERKERRREHREEKRERRREHRQERRMKRSCYKFEGVVEQLRNDHSFRQMVESLVDLSLEDRRADIRNETISSNNSECSCDSKTNPEFIGEKSFHNFQKSSETLAKASIDLCSMPSSYMLSTTSTHCNNCGYKITGTCYKCLTCKDYDLCQSCLAKNVHPYCEFRPLPGELPVVVPVQASLQVSTTDGDVYKKATFQGDMSPPAYSSPTRSLRYICNGPLCRESEREITGTVFPCKQCPDTHFCSNCMFLDNWKHRADHKFEFDYSALPCLELKNGTYMLTLLNNGMKTWLKNSKLLTEPTLNIDCEWQVPYNVLPGEIIIFKIAPSVLKAVDKWFMQVDNSKSFEVANFGFNSLFAADDNAKVKDDVVAQNIFDTQPLENQQSSSSCILSTSSSLPSFPLASSTISTVVSSTLVSYQLCGPMEYIFTFKNTGTVNWPEGLHVVEALLDGPRVKHSTENSVHIEPGTSASFIVTFELSGDGTIMLVSKTGKMFAREHVNIQNSSNTTYEDCCNTEREVTLHGEGCARSVEALDNSEVKFPTLVKESPQSSILKVLPEANDKFDRLSPTRAPDSAVEPLDYSDLSLSELETATDDITNSYTHHSSSDLETLSDLKTIESTSYSEDEYDVLTNSDLHD